MRTLPFSKAISALAAAIVAIALGSCAPAHMQVTAGVTPRLVWVDPGVWIVEDSLYASYYADGFYWRHVDGIWYRSPYYDAGFTQVQIGIVPRFVVGAYRPTHVRYRAPVRAHVRPIVRDHRTPRRHR